MITIDLESQTPLSDQIVRELRRAIAEATVVPGDELPPVRQLAADLGVNFNTVARAYRTLEASGLIRSARGRGTRVASQLEAAHGDGRQRVLEAIRAALVDARLAGLDRTRAEALIDREIEALWRLESAPEPTAQETTQP